MSEHRRDRQRHILKLEGQEDNSNLVYRATHGYVRGIPAGIAAFTPEYTQARGEDVLCPETACSLLYGVYAFVRIYETGS